MALVHDSVGSTCLMKANTDNMLYRLEEYGEEPIPEVHRLYFKERLLRMRTQIEKLNEIIDTYYVAQKSNDDGKVQTGEDHGHKRL